MLDRLQHLNYGLLYPLWIAAGALAVGVARLARRIWRRT